MLAKVLDLKFKIPAAFLKAGNSLFQSLEIVKLFLLLAPFLCSCRIEPPFASRDVKYSGPVFHHLGCSEDLENLEDKLKGKRRLRLGYEST